MGLDVQHIVSISVETLVLFLLLVGARPQTLSSLSRHGMLMALAVALHTIAVFTLMVPSLFSTGILLETSLGGILTWLHVALGVLADVWGAALVASWRFRNPERCVKRKAQMWPLYVAWVLSLILGMVVGLIYV
jgi:hypothetical protein